jgi:hypothetical protein
VASPTFTPDVPDRFTFRLRASDATGDAVSITDVSLTPPCPVLTFSPASLPSVVKNISWGAWLAAANGTPPFRYELQVGTVPPGLSLGTDGLLYGRPTTVGTYAFDIVAEDSFGCRGDYSYQITVTGGPTGLVAAGSGATSVAVSWNTVPGSPNYRVYRKSAGLDFTSLGSTNMTSWNDTPVATNAFYLYRVVAEEGANQSDPSNSDLATTMAFTDDPVVAGATPIRSVHITQLRTAVAAVRSLAGLPAAAWTPSMTTVQGDHVAELRSALADARSTLSLSTLGWTDPVITPATTTVKASHVNELRAGVR